MKKTGTILEKLLEGLFAGMMTAALLLVLLCSGTEYNCKITFLLPNWVLCGGALFVSLLLAIVGTNSGSWLPRQFGWLRCCWALYMGC